jgi:pyruvate/2-oxoglutarate dehydrogenase complex dihydrolipoamide dehydrogenase (E3) component
MPQKTAQHLAGAGMKVAIVERKFLGGTCVNTGCVLSKTMVASAYAAHIVRRAADFGVVNHGPVSVDMKFVKSRRYTSSPRDARSSHKSSVACGHARAARR